MKKMVMYVALYGNDNISITSLGSQEYGGRTKQPKRCEMKQHL